MILMADAGGAESTIIADRRLRDREEEQMRPSKHMPESDQTFGNRVISFWEDLFSIKPSRTSLIDLYTTSDVATALRKRADGGAARHILITSHRPSALSV